VVWNCIPPPQALAEDLTDAVRQVRILGERFQPIFHLRRKSRLNHAASLVYRHVALTSGAVVLGWPDPVAVVVIPDMRDIV
jgi:hypothetical protein